MYKVVFTATQYFTKFDKQNNIKINYWRHTYEPCKINK